MKGDGRADHSLCARRREARRVLLPAHRTSWGFPSAAWSWRQAHPPTFCYCHRGALEVVPRWAAAGEAESLSPGWGQCLLVWKGKVKKP